LNRPSIPLENKKIFLQWLLDTFYVENDEVRWLLEFLIENDDYLKIIRFTDHAEYCPRAIILRVKNFRKITFQFHKGEVVTTDVDKSYHDLRLMKQTSMFMQVDFDPFNRPFLYGQVLEKNPYLEDDLSSYGKKNAKKPQLKKENTQHYIKLLKKKIDLALDRKDEQKFYELTYQLKMLEKQLNQTNDQQKG